MKKFLTSNFGVREFHPMIEEFPQSDETPKELVRRLEESLTKNDHNLFKHEDLTELRGPIFSNSDHEDLGLDQRKRRTDEELVAELRNKLVIDIVEAHKGKQEAPADIEPVEILPE